MQGQRGAVGSFPEPLGFEHGSGLTDDVSPPSDILADYISLNVTNEDDSNEPPSSMLSLGDQASSSSSFSGPFELDDHRVTRKRKAVELNMGQSSSGIGSPNMFQRNESGLSLDPTIPTLGLSVGRVPSENAIEENAHRNVGLRMSSSSQQELLPGQSDVSDHYSSLRLNPIELSAPPDSATVDNSSSHPVLRIPALRRNFQSTSRWNRTLRANRSSNLDLTSDHSFFAPPSNERNSGQTGLEWSQNGGGDEPVNDAETAAAATSRAGTSSGPSPNYHPRRLSAFLRRSLLSATDLEAGGVQNGLLPRIPPVLSTPSSSSSQDIGAPPEGNIQGHHSRSPLLVARQLEGGVAFYPSRTMAGGIERRGRLVSEIRNVFESMRRGEALRFEDLMLLDQSVFYGIADNHDRHRDMRLDIDNMSYEELLALEDRIGNVNTGLTEEKISKHLKQTQYVIKTGQPDAEPCCICQEEYEDGNDLGTLECEHYFHRACIKQWLQEKNSCPICKSAGFAAAT